ncbi:T6SS immunity protein Tdi1 domain-containing protein [Clostridium butyricum]|uniref:T6SS immunity protein Tdi1 domain-containing protein n=1 Tax=Clostridium butyricum TaxID=1492 RepID=UPI00165246B8|nr:T6SS immunity protein Tdi1 domain-containing protein [Clostridium butyricum]
MFDRFLEYFGEKERINYSGDLYNNFLEQLGGKQLGNGLFTVFKKNDIERWTRIISDTFIDFNNKFKIFGYDWLGRCFGIDLREETKGNILMFEIGTDDVLEIPCMFEKFLEEEVPLYSDACLSEGFFHEWANYSEIKLKYGRCAGYKIPLFLGGEDIKENLEDSDMEVYWEILTQVIKQL